MSIRTLSIADIERLRVSEACKIMIDYQFAGHIKERVKALETAIDSAYSKITENRELYKDQSEDQITIAIVHMLQAMGIEASHDTKIGGHCDIVVRAVGNFLWIAEAKLDKGPSWIDEGYQQLTKRYSTGMGNQNYGEVIIYCRRKSTRQLLNNWKKKLLEKYPEVKITKNVIDDKLTFFTKHEHEISGLDFLQDIEY